MNSKSNGKFRVIILRRVITQLGYGFSMLLGSILLCLMGLRASADILYATGDNGYGQLGNGTTTPTNVMSPVLGLCVITADGTGASSSFAIQNGALFAWGYNTDGELGDGTNNESNIPVPVSGLSNSVAAVTAGLRHGLALQNGIVYAWGYNGAGELGNGAFDYMPHTTPAPVTGLSGVTAIAAGDYHSLALQNGAVYGWGWNNAGQLGQNGDTSSKSLPVLITGMNGGVTAIAAGSSFTLAIMNGAVWGCGANDYGQLGNGTTTYAQSSVVQTSGLNSGVTAIAAGYQHALAVSNGVVYAWGRNYYGELGDGVWTSSYVPVMVAGLPGNIVAVAAGYGSSYALSADGRLWVWGNGLSGELGTGANLMYNTPQEVHAPAGYRFASINSEASGYYAMARLGASAPQIGGTNSVGIQSGNFGFTITGVKNQTIVVEASTNLVDWQPVWTNTLSGTFTYFDDSQWSNFQWRFYRAK